MTPTAVVQRLRALEARVSDEAGQAMVEYALLVSLVTLAAFVAVQAFGQGLAGLYSHIVAVYP